MSKMMPENEYKKTKAGRFMRFMKGDKDPYFDQVEMKKLEESELNHDKEQEEMLEERRKLHSSAYDLSKNTEVKAFGHLYRILSVGLTVILIAVLLMMVSQSPSVGEADNPGSNTVSERYITKGMQETGAVNVVTGMILDYRAFDTFGESNVLFMATICVFILLRLDKDKNGKSDKKAKAEANDRKFEPKNDVILQCVAKILVPFIILFGIYVILNGHLSPGGGFSGGAIIGAGFILYLNAFGFKKTERFFTANTYKWVCFSALSFYCLAKSYSFFTGANHLHSIISTGVPGRILSGGLILYLNICVGMVVACTMYAFYAMFRKGGF
ncbi:MAG: hydrogen gas-evolving membrane-bound hydrogenase subunit E [Lachnospiraceae bacterium]